MLESHDYSGRRGVLVPLMPKVHALLTETAKKEPLAGIEPPINIILWRQEIYKLLVEIHRRWLMVMDGPAIAGLMFFYFDKNGDTYINELRIAWPYRHNNGVFPLLIDRFMKDPGVKNSKNVFAGPNVKKEANQELLASVGFEAHFENGWEPLGNPTDAAGVLKLRYLR